MPEALARQLAEIESASTADLRARWEWAHKHPAPKRASRDLLLRTLAYHIQERAEGGLSKAALKRLVLLADPKGNDGRPPRPALQQLLADIRARKVDTVVVYKVDRLTLSLADFAKIVEVFDRRGVSFVSVTQQFNTTTSMGRPDRPQG